MKSILKFVFITVIIVSSCKGSTGEESSAVQSRQLNPEDSLFHEVLKGHDEGMAKVGRLKKYSRVLEILIDSIRNNPSTDKSALPPLQRVKDSLDAANTSMFTWMDEFKADTLTGMTAERMRDL